VIKRIIEREKFAHDFVLKTNNNLLKQANSKRLRGREKISSFALEAGGLNTWVDRLNSSSQVAVGVGVLRAIRGWVGGVRERERERDREIEK
jgi:hypothetical protein